MPTIDLVESQTGKSIVRFELPPHKETTLGACFQRNDKLILHNFAAHPYSDTRRRDFDYWIAFDAAAQKILWRTEPDSKSASSLLPFAD